MASNKSRQPTSREASVPHYWHLAEDSVGVAMTDLEYAILRVFEAQHSRRAMIAMFLAVLEMVRMQAVVVAQKDLFGEIALQRHTSFDAVFASDQPISAIEKDYI